MDTTVDDGADSRIRIRLVDDQPDLAPVTALHLKNPRDCSAASGGTPLRLSCRVGRTPLRLSCRVG